ncbi:MAG: hypothetical protein WDW38_003390 [Sanguina aurantia]
MIPASNAKRYDRQIRIWGPHGQARLEKSSVALLNCGPTGSETLKNLVLGGIGSFTIVDGHRVTSTDIGNNFFVHHSNLGESRAKVTTELLKELNEAVAGSYVEEDPAVLLDSNPGFFSEFSLVVATQMRETEMLRLEEICEQAKVPLLVVRIYGLVGYLRASLAEHRVIESKPDSAVDDLRMNQPWAELQEFANSFDLSTIDDITLHHLPYAVLLIKAAAAWRAEHSSLPSTSKERRDFKESIGNMKRMAGEVPVESENFDEAVKAAFQVWTAYAVPSEVRLLLDDEQSSVTTDSDEFWIMVASLKAFLEHEGSGCLPLDGSIPDMHATTDLYLRIQRLYRECADRDVQAVERHARALLQELGRDAESVSTETVRCFCKNARNLRVVRYRSLREELGAASQRSAALQKALTGESTAPAMYFYVLLRAVDRFHVQHGRYPGSHDDTLEDDVTALRAMANQAWRLFGGRHVSTPAGFVPLGPNTQSETGVLESALPCCWRAAVGVATHGAPPDSSAISEDYIVEMVRCGAGELHVMGAFMGGVAAQEAIKLITRQFVPVAGTMIYNAIGCTTTVLEL